MHRIHVCGMYVATCNRKVNYSAAKIFGYTINFIKISCTCMVFIHSYYMYVYSVHEGVHVSLLDLFR